MAKPSIASFSSHSEEETLNWAVSFSKRLAPGDAVGLGGNLGAGKTVIARGIARGLKFTGSITSPSYMLVNEYPGRTKIYHIDLFRLQEDADWEEIGIDYYFNQKGVCLVEWPERLKALGITFNFMIHIEFSGENSREIRVEEFKQKSGSSALI